MRAACVLVLVTGMLLWGSGLALADFGQGRASHDRGDYKSAFNQWKPLAEQGDREAQVWLGRLYEMGNGVQRDLAEAHKWYVLAWKRSVPDGRQRALDLRRRLTKEQLADSRRRVRTWLDDFKSKRKPARAVSAAARGDLAAFYKQAYARTQSPPDNARLRILCGVRVGDTHVTFVTHDGTRALLVAMTPQPLVDPREDISLTWQWRPRGTRGRRTATSDWAYVFDRNRDGRVDYLCYLDGPSSVIPDPRPREFYKRVPESRIEVKNGRTRVSIFAENNDQLRYAKRHLQQVFWHLADDDFDGRPDGFVVSTRDLKSAWIDGRMVVRSTKFDGRFDRCRYVPGAAGVPQATCKRTKIGYGVPGRVLSGLHEVPLKDWPLLEFINEAVRMCGLTSRHLRAR